jgi:hypothetical protein
LQEKLTQLKERKGCYDGLLKELEQGSQKRVALTDRDARTMKGPHCYVVGYNVQVAVDSKHDLIVAQEVVQAANDRGQLAPMAQAAKEQLGVKSLQAVADKGYYQADQLQVCEQAGIEPFVPQPGRQVNVARQGQSLFGKAQFHYDRLGDAYRCPGDRKLQRRNQYQIKGAGWVYYYNARACQGCRLRGCCTPCSYRVVVRRSNEAVVERAAARVAARPDLQQSRKKIVEHVFGTLRQWNHDCFLTRGLEKVRAEFSLSSLVYNLRRVLNLIGTEELLKALRQRPLRA